MSTQGLGSQYPITRAGPIGGGGAASTHPFRLSDATEAGVKKVRVQFGMLNALTPADMDAIDGLIMAVGSDGYVVLAVTTDTDGLATGAAISLQASVPDDTETAGHIALGYVSPGETSVACSQSVTHSLWHQMCGTTTHLFGSV